MMEDIQSYRRTVQQNIEKGFNDDFAGMSLERQYTLTDMEHELEKAYHEGDVLFVNGKTYVYTQYLPGKYDWHIFNKKSRAINGTGYKGMHGIKAITKLYEDISSKTGQNYTDPQKFCLRRSPNGHWRLDYDGNYTGEAVAGDMFTENEMRADDVMYKRAMIVDNFELAKGYMEFNSPDDVYFVQVIKRYKDNKDKPDAEKWKQDSKALGTYHSGAEYIKHYLIHSEKELDAVKGELIKLCEYNNARAYISINPRNETATNAYIAKKKQQYAPGTAKYEHADEIAYGAAKSGKEWANERFRVLLDIDCVKSTDVTMPNGKKVNVWDETKRRLNSAGVKIVAEYETPSGGLHVILNNKNNRNLPDLYKGFRDFDGGKDLKTQSTVHPSEDIKMVLYSNVVNEGY